MPVVKEKEFQSFLENKNVVLVGPSQAIEGKGLGSFFDSFDVVVRLNRAVSHMENSMDLGTKTDILYHCLSTGKLHQLHPRTKKLEVDPEKFIEANVKYISSVYPSFTPHHSSMRDNIDHILSYDKINFRPIAFDPYIKLQSEAGEFPNTGLIVISDLLASNLKSLHLYGIDFHRTIYMRGYETFTRESLRELFKNHSQHNPDDQFKFFKYKIYNTDKRIVVDESLRHFLSDKKYENTL